jgi:uncharacterized protein YyaL (SSP411 family)
LVAGAEAQLAASYDPRWGGFGGAPKFPPSASLRLLLRHHARTGAARALAMVRGTLDGMKNGGMYDHVGGGFARYSTDERWHVPHFEKMLYDNGQLARVYLEAFQVTQDAEYARVARETLDYALREMQSPDGGFYSATDADSEGVEGKFFTFSHDELASLLDAEHARAVGAYFDVLPAGNWEGTNVLWTPRPLPEVAAQLGTSSEALATQVNEAKRILYAARQKRVPPLLDDKILVSWNALMIGALAEGARILGEARYREAAERASDDLLRRLRRPDGGLYRTARNGKAHLEAYLEDYAYLGDALIDLYECGSDLRYLDEARGLAERMLRDFRDEEGGGFFHTAHAHEPLIARSREVQDDALPNANAVAAQLCARLSFHFDREDLRKVAEATLESYGQVLPRAPRAFASLLLVADLLTHGPVEVALIGPAADPRTQALAQATARVFLPARILAHGLGNGAGDLPLLAGKHTLNGAPAAYVCRNFACAAPVTDPVQLERALASG